MGVVGSIIGSLGMAFLNGRAQQAQYEAAARQADTNAKIQQINAETMERNSAEARKNAEEAARVATMNTEKQRRQAALSQGKLKANIGASGVYGGSTETALIDNLANLEYDTKANLENSMKDSYNFFNQSTNFTNQKQQYQYQADVYRKNASDYRAAGSRAFMTSMLSGALSAGVSAFGGLGGAASTGANTTGYSLGQLPSAGTWAGKMDASKSWLYGGF